MEPLPKRKAIRLPGNVYTQGNAFFITIATADRHPWFQLYASLAESLVQLIKKTAQQRNAVIYAWCVMPDHCHILLQDSHITDFVRLVKGKLTSAARQIDPGRTLWQHSFYDHGVRKAESTKEIAAYIWQNPVRAALVKRTGDYPFSGSMAWPHWRNFE